MAQSTATTGRSGTPNRTAPTAPTRHAARTGLTGLTGLSAFDAGDGVVVLALTDAALTQGLGELRWRLDPVVAGGTHTVEIDLSEVDRLSSGCIATLLWVKRTCAARHIRVVVRRPTTRTLDQLRRTGLAGVLEIRSQAS